MQCKRDKQDASRYLSDLMDERERLDYEAHLDECAGCREELARYRRMLVMLDEMPVEKAPLGLSRALDEAASEHFGGGERTKSIYARRPAVLRVAVAAVLVGAIIMVAYFALNLGMPPLPKDNGVATQDRAGTPAPEVAVSDDAGLVPPERVVAFLAIELDKPAEGYSEEQMEIIYNNAENARVEDLLELYNDRVNLSSNLAGIPVLRDEAGKEKSVPQTALQAAEKSARLKRLYVAATRRVQTEEQVDNLREATEISQRKIVAQNRQLAETNAPPPKSMSRFAHDKSMAGAGAVVDLEMLKQREKELTDALDVLVKGQAKSAPSIEGNGEDKDMQSEKDDSEIAQREALERELVEVRDAIKNMEQKTQEPPCMTLGKASASDTIEKAAPENEQSDAADVKGVAPEEPAPEISVRPIFRQTLVVQSAAGDLNEEQIAEIFESLKPLLAEKAGGVSAGSTMEVELTDEQIARLLDKLARVGGLDLVLGPLEAGFVPEPAEDRESAKADGAAEETLDTEPRTILLLCLIRSAGRTP